MKLRSAIAFGALGLFSACGVEEPTSGIEQDIKGKNKMFATSRLQHNVEVFDQDGEEKESMAGAGINTPFGVHVEGDNIYVVSRGTNSVYAHIHEHGENASEHHKLRVLVSGDPAQNGGLSGPFYPMVHGDHLYVSSGTTNKVLRYDAATGVFDREFATANLSQPRGIDFDSAGTMFVASFLTSQVLQFDSNGGFVRVFASVPSPCGVSIDENDRVCVGSAAGTGVHCFDANGTRFYNNGTGNVCGLDWGRDGNIYVTRTEPILGTNTRIEVHDFVNPATTFAVVPSVAALSWGGTE